MVSAEEKDEKHTQADQRSIIAAYADQNSLCVNKACIAREVVDHEVATDWVSILLEKRLRTTSLLFPKDKLSATEGKDVVEIEFWPLK